MLASLKHQGTRSVIVFDKIFKDFLTLSAEEIKEVQEIPSMFQKIGEFASGVKDLDMDKLVVGLSNTILTLSEEPAEIRIDVDIEEMCQRLFEY